MKVCKYQATVVHADTLYKPFCQRRAYGIRVSYDIDEPLTDAQHATQQAMDALVGSICREGSMTVILDARVPALLKTHEPDA